MTYDVCTGVTTFRSPAWLARSVGNRNTCLPLELRAKRLFNNVGGAQTGAQEKAESKDKGGAELHNDVLGTIGDGVCEIL